jgi:hypothetical protein
MKIHDVIKEKLRGNRFLSHVTAIKTHLGRR